jgi:hypothetical protein
MSNLQFDFVVYTGDPDAGAESRSSREALAEPSVLPAEPWSEVYGAVVAHEGEKRRLDARPDPIFSLVTNLVKAVGYVIDGETETVLLSESEHGFAIEPNGNDVIVSFFAGDAFEPEEFLLEPETLPMQAFAEQLLSMGERLRDLMKATDPEVFERDDYSKSLLEFLDEGRDRLKKLQLEMERGLRVQ